MHAPTSPEQLDSSTQAPPRIDVLSLMAGAPQPGVEQQTHSNDIPEPVIPTPIDAPHPVSGRRMRVAATVAAGLAFGAAVAAKGDIVPDAEAKPAPKVAFGKVPSIKGKDGKLRDVLHTRAMLRRAGFTRTKLLEQKEEPGKEITKLVDSYWRQVKDKEGKTKLVRLTGRYKKPGDLVVLLRRAVDEKPVVPVTPPIGNGQESPQQSPGAVQEGTPAVITTPTVEQPVEADRPLTAADRLEIAQKHLEMHGNFKVPFMSNTGAYALTDPETNKIKALPTSFHGGLRPEMSVRTIDESGQVTIHVSKPLEVTQGNTINNLSVVPDLHIDRVIIPKDGNLNSDFALLVPEGESAQEALDRYVASLATDEEVMRSPVVYLAGMPYHQFNNPSVQQQFFEMKPLSPFVISSRPISSSPLLRLNVIAFGVKETSDGALPTIGASGNYAITVVGDTLSAARVKIVGSDVGTDDFRSVGRNANSGAENYGATVRAEKQALMSVYGNGADISQYDGLTYSNSGLNQINPTLDSDGDLIVAKLKYTPS